MLVPTNKTTKQIYEEVQALARLLDEAEKVVAEAGEALDQIAPEIHRIFGEEHANKCHETKRD